MTMSAYVSTGGAPVPMAKNSNIMMLFVFSLLDLISHTANPRNKLKGDNSGPKFIDAIWETIARTAHEH